MDRKNCDYCAAAFTFEARGFKGRVLARGCRVHTPQAVAKAAAADAAMMAPA